MKRKFLSLFLIVFLIASQFAAVFQFVPNVWANPDIVWTETFTSFTPAGTDWQDYDIFTNKGVSKGAIAEIIIASVNDAVNRVIGVRTDGSSLDRYINLHEAEAGGATTVNMLVKVHETTGLIETYCDATTGVTYYLTGYWTGVDFTEMSSTFSPTEAAVWHDKNLFSDLAVPKGSVCQIHIHHNTQDAAKTAGVRKDGSSLERKMSIHEAEGLVTATNGYDTYVKTSTANGIIDIYGTDTTTVFFLLLGYFDSTMDYTELWTQKDVTTSTVWTDFDLTADLDQDGRVTNFVLTHSYTAVEVVLGARTDGSGLLRCIQEHESESNLYTGFGIIVQSDPSTGIVELYCTSATYDYFWLAGYFKWEAGAQEVSYSFTEIIRPSATLNQWQEHYRSWTETITPSATMNVYQEIIYTYIKTITATETVTYYQEHIRTIQETVQPSATPSYLQEQSYVLTQIITPTEIITYYQEQIYVKTEQLAISETLQPIRVEGIFMFTQIITQTESISYWQEHSYIYQETTVPTATLGYWIEGIQVFYETFTETISPSSIMNYWIEISHAFSEFISPSETSYSSGEGEFIIIQTITPSEFISYRQEHIYILTETLDLTTILNIAMELAETFITNIETLTPQAVLYYSIQEWIEEIPIEFALAALAIILALVALALVVTKKG